MQVRITQLKQNKKNQPSFCNTVIVVRILCVRLKVNVMLKKMGLRKFGRRGPQATQKEVSARKYVDGNNIKLISNLSWS